MKQKRHQKIIELIEKYEIKTQDELTDILCRNGYNVTQATVSRDIKELRLTKTANGKSGKKYVYNKDDQVHMAAKYARIVKDGLVHMEAAQNIVVFKTVPGMAMAVAAAIDSMHFDEIVGSIAGDDTIMAVTKTSESADHLLEQMRETLEKEA